MFLYLFDMMDEGIVNLTGENADKVTELRGTLEKALLQLRGENWSRLVITANVPLKGDESVALVREDTRNSRQLLRRTGHPRDRRHNKRPRP